MHLLKRPSRRQEHSTRLKRLIPAPAHPQGILVVEHRTTNQTMLGLLLGQQRIPFWLACDGREAVQIYQQHALEIGFVLMELQLPGWDGPLTLSALKEIDPGVRCYFMNDDRSPYSDEELLCMGNVGLVDAAFLSRILGEFVRQCLSRV